MVGKIAQKTELSPSYLSKILQRLANIGILYSRRGAKGGYRLSRPAADITLSEIVATSKHIEKGPMPCMLEARDCDATKPCTMHKFVARAESSLWRRLDGITLANIFTPSFELNQGEIK